MQKAGPFWKYRVKAFSVHTPVAELIEQISPHTLRIRLRYHVPYDQLQKDCQWQELDAELTGLLKGHGLDTITLE